MRVRLSYGSDGLDVELPDKNVTVIEPAELPGLPDEAAVLREALQQPIDSPPLAELIAPSGEIAVVFPDVTRPMPSLRVLPVLLDYLGEQGVGDERIVLLSGTGTHRANTPAELVEMIGRGLLDRYEVVNHDCREASALTLVGHVAGGAPLWLNNRYVAATTRILTGFIEPHFFAGFSGGPKMVCPGVAGSPTILHAHNAAMIGHLQSTWGVTVGNPIHDDGMAYRRRPGT